MRDLLAFTFGTLPRFWPLASAIVAIAIIALAVPRDRVGVFSLAAAVLWVVTGPVWIMLGRVELASQTLSYDLNAWLLAAAFPLAVAAIVGRHVLRAGRPPAIRAICVLASGLLALLPCPWILLIVHCFSGDCL